MTCACSAPSCDVCHPPMTSVRRELARQNMRYWLEAEAAKLGTEVQQAAHAKGTLLESEILTLARTELFKGFSVARWQPIRWQDCPHTGCSTPGKVQISSALWPYDRPPVMPEWSCGEDDKAPHDAPWGVLQGQMNVLRQHEWAVRCPSLLPAMSIHIHTAKCDACHGFIKRVSALISIPWAGRMLSREYAL